MNKHKKLLLIFAWAFVLPAFVVSQVSFWTTGEAYAQEATVDTSEIKDDISDLQKKLDKEQKAKEKLQQNLGQIQQSVSITQLAISKTKKTITETEADIERKEADIEALNKKIQLQTEALKIVLQEVYYSKKQPLIGVVLSGQEFSSAFGVGEEMVSLQEKIRSIVADINETKAKIGQDTEELAKNIEEHEEVLSDKLDQKQELVAVQADVQSDIADKQKTIDRLNREISELQGDLNKVLGKSYNAKDIKQAVEFASGKTGVPKGFLFGMLKMETNLGANVGGCTYGEVEKGAEASYKAKKLGARAWATFLARRDTFKGICKELGIDYQKQKVSCNPRGYVGTGGAMGVAQFMPDTWNGYKRQVSGITGHSPASPWDLTDGVTAMALKLSRVPGVTAGKTSAMKSAACAYLGTCYAPYINGILYWADNYKSLL